MCSQRTGYLVFTPMCLKTGFYVHEDGLLPRVGAVGAPCCFRPSKREAPCRRRRGDGDKPLKAVHA